MDKFLSRKRTFDDNKASTSAQTSIVPKIKSKYSQEYLNFGFTITEVNGEEKPLCVICSKILAADSMKPNKLKRHFETLHVHTLSNDTVSHRIDDIAEDIEQQLFGKLRDKLFSIQLDEATDSNKDAHFIAYVRFWDDDFMRGRIIGKIEEGRKITDAAREFDIAHSIVSRLWKLFKTTGMCSKRHGEVVLEVRRLQKTDISSYTQKEHSHHSSAGGKSVSC
ncbi:SCAN domain-containing protein 3 [Trichonephila clavipes]|nr:SCAN domain-containing protein 3 [Trichonephila clavipes]